MAKRRLKNPDVPDGDRRGFFLFMQDLVVENGDLSTTNLGRLVHFNHQGIYRALTGPTMPSLKLTVALSRALGGEHAEELARTYWSAGVKEQRRSEESSRRPAEDAVKIALKSDGRVTLKEIAGSLEGSNRQDLEDPAKDEILMQRVAGSGALAGDSAKAELGEKAAPQEPVETVGLEYTSHLDVIIVDAVGGDRDALREVLAWIRPPVVRYCRARLGPAESDPSADDVAQEICLEAITTLPRLVRGWRTLSMQTDNSVDQTQSAWAWLYAIMREKVENTRVARIEEQSRPVSDGQSQTTAPSASTDPAMAKMDALLNVLPDRYREVLVLRLIAGLTVEETAQATGMSPGSIRVTQHRALARLKDHLTETESSSGTARSVR
jgi:RNA polymerase sigma-70 factor (ECF subfamily)